MILPNWHSNCCVEAEERREEIGGPLSFRNENGDGPDVYYPHIDNPRSPLGLQGLSLAIKITEALFGSPDLYRIRESNLNDLVAKVGNGPEVLQIVEIVTVRIPPISTIGFFL